MKNIIWHSMRFLIKYSYYLILITSLVSPIILSIKYDSLIYLTGYIASYFIIWFSTVVYLHLDENLYERIYNLK
jgi:hypothetical protein